jgi:hypothetical protein
MRNRRSLTRPARIAGSSFSRLFTRVRWPRPHYSSEPKQRPDAVRRRGSLVVDFVVRSVPIIIAARINPPRSSVGVAVAIVAGPSADAEPDRADLHTGTISVPAIAPIAIWRAIPGVVRTWAAIRISAAVCRLINDSSTRIVGAIRRHVTRARQRRRVAWAAREVRGLRIGHCTACAKQGRCCDGK